MAIGTSAAFTIYHEQFYGGWSEAVEQNVEVFNSASSNCIQLRARGLKGHYEQQTFMKTIANLITRRDPASVAAATDLPLAMGEISTVKLNRKIGPVAHTIDALRKIGRDEQEISFVLGQQVGLAVAQEYVSTVMGAVRAALNANAGVLHDGTAGTMTHTMLTQGLQKFGDASNRIACWVMHSKVYFDLMRQAIADKIVEVAGVTIYNGTVATFNRPVIVTDDAALIDAPATPDQYHTFGLVQGGVLVEESEERDIVSQLVTGLENLAVRLQGEYAYNLGLKGYTWDVTNGGVNPASAAIITGTNWDKVATDDRSTAGVVIKSQ